MYHYIITLALGMSWLATSCNPDGKTITTEGTTPSGFTYFKYTNIKGEKAEVGDKVSFHETVMLGKDSTFISQLREVILPPPEEVLGAAPNYEVMFLISPGDSITTFITGEDMETYRLNPKDTLYFHIGFKEIVARRAEVAASTLAEAAEMEKRQAEMEAAANKIGASVNKTLENYRKNALGNSLIKTASGLQYVIHEEGDGPSVEANDIVETHYYGIFTKDGTPFDNSYSRGEPISFTVGTGQVIPGWDEGLQYLRKGSKASFFIPAKLAYGKDGAGSIPPNTELMFYVELVDVKK